MRFTTLEGTAEKKCQRGTGYTELTQLLVRKSVLFGNCWFSLALKRFPSATLEFKGVDPLVLQQNLSAFAWVLRSFSLTKVYVLNSSRCECSKVGLIRFYPKWYGAAFAYVCLRGL